MLKLMIVDDEAVIRKGLETMIDWEMLGMKLVAQASNGRDALERALLLQPDIVLTDIKMPLVNGVDFADRLLKKRPWTHIVFLTGYSDYEYMQKAVKLGASDYLLKPVKVTELEMLMLRIRDEIMEERRKIQEKDSVTKILAKNRPILRGNCLQLFMKGKLSEDSFLSEAAQMGISLKESNVAVVLDIDDYYSVSVYADDEHQVRYAVLNVAEEMLSRIGEAAFGYLAEESSLLGVINLEHGNTEDVAEACRQLQFYVQKAFKFTITAAVGSEASNPIELRESCRNAFYTMKRKLYEGKNQVFLSNQSELKFSEKTIFLKKQDENELREAFAMRNNLHLQKKLDEIITKYLTKEQYSAASIRDFGLSLLLPALYALEDENITQEEAYGADIHLREEMTCYETLDEMHMFIKNIYFRTLQALENQKMDGRNRIVRESIRYVKKNYAKGIQVTDVAAAVYVTPNYFSKVFKQEMGENFTEWLNKFRIEKAKELLRNQSDEKIYEIAEQTGFTDYKYFSFLFKKYTGYTPITWKKLNS